MMMKPPSVKRPSVRKETERHESIITQIKTRIKRMANQVGRPKVEEKAKFRNVAVPLETYEMLREVADREERTMARQIGVLIRKAYEEKTKSTSGQDS
jgi:hypothetical protein